MLGSKAVTEVLKRINAAKIKKTKAASDTEVQFIRAYKYEKGEKETGEYIVVNHLPFTHGQGRNVENGTVNVNVHVPVLKSGIVPTKRLEELCAQVIELFPEDTYINGAYYSYYCDSRPMLDNDETYFVNLQIEVIYNNLQGEELTTTH